MKKRKIIVSCVAVILAVAMLAGGTFTYLTGESREVVNTITANYNSVELHETDPETGDNTQGNEYEIVPGMSDDKDPVVTVNYTLDSYVYVTVTDITDELIEYMIASGWTEITDLESTDANTGAVTKVYYQLVTTEDTDAEVNTTMSTNSVTVYTKTLEVLENNSISYATSITNEQMLDASGNLIEDLSLTFKAYIMQADPFLSNNSTEYDGAIAAYYAMLNDPTLFSANGYSAMVNGVLYETVGEAVSAALESGGTSTVTVYADSELTETMLLTLDNSSATSANITLDLNGNTISASSVDSTYNALIRVGEGVTLTITGEGVVDGTDMDDENELIWARGGTVIIESGTFISQTANEACVYASTPNGSTSVGTVYIYGGTFKNTATGTYAYGSSLSPLTLNVWNGTDGSGYNDQNVSSGDIYVYGGVFYGNDPANGDDHLSTKTPSDTQRAVTTFVADGYTSTVVTLTDGTAYVVAKTDASAITVYASEALSFSNALTAATAATANATDPEITVVLAEGSYTVESADLTSLSGVTIEGSTSGTTYLDATALASTSTSSPVEDISISNVTFTSTATTNTPSAFKFTGSGTFTNCVFDYTNGTSSSAARALTATGDLTFENCTFVANVYALNLSANSSLEAKVTLKNCDVTGWTSFGGASLTLVVEDCSFHNSAYAVDTEDPTGNSMAYGVLRFYQNATVTNCTFDSDFEFIDCATSGKTITINNSTWTAHDIADLLYLADMGVTGVTWTVDGTEVTVDSTDWWN